MSEFYLNKLPNSKSKERDGLLNGDRKSVV